MVTAYMCVCFYSYVLQDWNTYGLWLLRLIDLQYRIFVTARNENLEATTTQQINYKYFNTPNVYTSRLLQMTLLKNHFICN